MGSESLTAPGDRVPSPAKGVGVADRARGQSPESVAERVSASDVVRQAAALVGGGGGGRPTMARAGGKDPERLPEALAEAERLIVAALS